MASPVKDAKLKAQQIWPGAIVVERGKGSIKHQHPTDPDKFMLDTQVGGRGWHFDDGPFTEANEVDTAWVDAHPIDDAPWQKKMVLADYNAYAFREPTLGFDQGQLIEYRHPASGETVNFQPQQLQWTNDLDQISPIADPQAVAATIDDDTLTWADAYGTGVDFRWFADTARLSKYVDFDTLAHLGSPPQFIIDGGNPLHRVELLFQKSAGVEIWVEGVLWDEKANNPQETLDNVEFRLAGVPIWWFKAPKAWDTAEEIAPIMRLRKSGPNLFVEILTPWSWLETATYPVVIDAIVEESIDASGDDGYIKDFDSTFNNTGQSAYMGHSGGDCNSWFRFDIIGPNSGDDIDTAFISHNCKGNADQCNWDIYAEDVDSAAAPTSYADYISKESNKTSASVYYAAPVWDNKTFYDITITAVVQEIIDLPGWASGNYIQILNLNNGSDSGQFKQIAAFDWLAPRATLLHVEYTAGGGVATLEPDDCDHGHSADTGALSTVYALEPADCEHDHLSDPGALSTVYQLEPADCDHSHIADQSVLTQQTTLSPADCDHSHAAEQGDLSTVYDLVPAGCDHGHVADQGDFSTVYDLQPTDTNHAHAVDQGTVTTVYVLEPADCDHAHSTDQGDLTTVYALEPTDTDHDHSADQCIVTEVGSGYLYPNDADHSHYAEQGALTTVYVLEPADADHSHTADQSPLTLNLVPDDVDHGHIAEQTILSTLAMLEPVDADHGHYADQCIVAEGGASIVYPADCNHRHILAIINIYVSDDVEEEQITSTSHPWTHKSEGVEGGGSSAGGSSSWK